MGEELIQMLTEAYQGMSAEDIHTDMVSTGAADMFADPWLVASFVAYKASGV